MAFEVGATLVMLGMALQAAPDAVAPAAPSPAAPARPSAAPPAAPPPAAAPKKAVPPAASDANAAPPEAAPPASPEAPPPEAVPPVVAPTSAPPSAGAAPSPSPSPSLEPSAPAAPAAAGAPATAADGSSAPAAQSPEAPVVATSAEAPVPAQPGVVGGGGPVDKAEAAGTVPENALPPGQIDVPGGLSVAIGTQMSFGQSTFQVGGGYARDPMVDWSLSLSPSYMFSDGTRVSASASLSQELTEANGDDDPQTLVFSDIGLSVGRSLYRFEGGPQLFGSLSMQLPISESSRIETLRTSLGARLSASQPVGPVFLSLGTGFRKNFHEYTHPTRNPNTGDPFTTRDGLVIEEIVTGIARTGGSELAGATYFEGESNNTSMVWSSSLSAFWPVSEKVGFAISYNFSQSWTYESYDLDELSGVGAAGGRGRRDSHGGSLSASYQPWDQLSFSVGMGTGGPTRTADDKRIRFPFFNFEGAESNMTTFFISATYTEAIPL
jgi:hypothetical protein